MLIFSRSVTGIGSAGISVMVQIVISGIVAVHERGKYTGFIGMSFGLASVVGPLLGGYFTDHVSWRWCFLINIPVGVIAGVSIFILIKTPRPHDKWLKKVKRIDFAGITLLLLGLILVLLGLNFGGVELSWSSAAIICLLIFGVVALAVFAFHQAKFPAEPIITIQLFKIRNFWSVIVTQFFVGFSFYGLIYYLPVFDSVVYNGTASQSGIFLLPFVISLVVLSITSGLLITKTGRFRIFFRIGTFLISVGIGLMITLSKGTPKALDYVYMIIAGAGNGMTNQPLVVCVQASVPNHMIGIATSTVVFTRTLSGAISIAIIAAAQRTALSSKFRELIQRFPNYKDTIASVTDNTSVIHNPSMISSDLKLGLIQAYTESLQLVFIILCVSVCLSFIFTLIIKHVPLKKPSEPPQESC